ncbi:hypothetical protein K438DRAFT_525724 [Mycena galopus ATCC 62051]|nr:hypothetical protein K438DRAFT_525724 [Mycena galopus ATCC 62051]
MHTKLVVCLLRRGGGAGWMYLSSSPPRAPAVYVPCAAPLQGAAAPFSRSPRTLAFAYLRRPCFT